MASVGLLPVLVRLLVRLEEGPDSGDDLLRALARFPVGQEIEIEALGGRPLFLGRRGEDESSGLAALTEGDVAPEEVAEGFQDGPVGEAQSPRVRLDLLADGSAAEQEAVEVLIPLAEEDLVRLEVEPAQDAQAGLVEIAADRGVGGALRIQEAALSGLGDVWGGHGSEDASRAGETIWGSP